MSDEVRNLSAPVVRCVVAFVMVIAVSAIPVQDIMAASEPLRLHSGDKTVVGIGEGLPVDASGATINARFRDECLEAEFEGEYYLILQFEDLLSTAAREGLSDNGLELMEYIPPNAYLARLPSETDITSLMPLGLAGYYVPVVGDKLPGFFYDFLANERPGGEFEVRVFWVDLSPESLNSALTKLPGDPYVSLSDNNHYLTTEMNAEEIIQTARLPFVVRIEPHSDSVTLDGCALQTERNFNETHPRGDFHTTSTRANYITSQLSGHPGLTGEDVIVGVGDIPYFTVTHVDMQGRHTVLDPDAWSSPLGNHGIHTSGTVGGNGVRLPRFVGLAPKAYVYTAMFGEIFTLGLTMPDPMIISSNSWSNTDPVYGGDWYDNFGRYNIYSREIDQTLRINLPFLSVHSAGNAGGEYDGFPFGYQMVNPSHGSAKNTLVVGRKSRAEDFYTVSSYGPTRDGRIKPDVISETFVVATIDNDDYALKDGSSMSTPTVAGVTALLYERYRQLNAGFDPDGGLIKAVLMNSADYLLVPGPSFAAGYGKVNARRAEEIIDNVQYGIDEVNYLEERSYYIDVPTTVGGKNVVGLKVMLYWDDLEASLYADPALVNNLDLEVIQGATTYLPWVLDPSPANVELPAVTGVDNINNVEQVAIDYPTPGTHEIHVSGVSVPYGPQKFYVIYSYILEETVLTFPIGGEKMFSGQTRNIFWDSHNIGTGNAADAVDYSPDGGSNWYPVTHDLAVYVAPGASMPWKVPVLPLTEVLVRVTQDGRTAISEPFVVSEEIVLSMTDVSVTEVEFSWNTIPGASSYEMMRLVFDDQWESFVLTTANSMVMDRSSVSSDRTWISVRGVDYTGTIRSQRSEAVVFDYVNSPPDAVNDTISMGTFPFAYAVYPKTNDSDPESDRIFIGDVTEPQFGTAEERGGEYIFYTHDGTPTDLDFFRYTLCDGRGGTDEATVIITSKELCCGLYTDRITGNANCSEDGKITLSDISRLVDRVYISKAPLCCEANGNTNGDPDCLITLSDISRLIDVVYITKAPPEECMPECEL